MVDKTGLQIQFNERMERIDRQGDTFVVSTSRQRYHARSVVLAIGAEADDRVATALAASGVPVQRIGDCASVNYIEGAMHDGNRAGREV